MRIVVVATLLAIGGTASAQPGAAPPPPPYPQQQPYPQQGYPPPPQQYQPGVAYPVALTPDEHELLMQGEISEGAQFGGGLAELFVGFGSGQAIQGRWSDTGWIFTLGETATMVAIVSGSIRMADQCIDTLDREVNCDHSDGAPLLVVGLIGFTVFRIWGTIDAFAGPSDHNRRVRELKWRMGMPMRVGVQPYLNRTRDGGGTAGISLSF